MGKKKSIVQYLGRAELAILAFLGIAQTLIMFSNAIGRYFFEYTFPWAEEVTRILFVWAMFLAITTAFIRNQHIGFTAFAEKNAWARGFSEFFYDITLLDVGFILARYGWNYTKITGHVPLPGTDLPTAVFLLPGVIAGVVWSVTGLIRLGSKLREKIFRASGRRGE